MATVGVKGYWHHWTPIWTAFTDLGAGLDFVVNWSVIPKLCLAFRVMANNKVHDFITNPHTSVSRSGKPVN